MQETDTHNILNKNKAFQDDSLSLLISELDLVPCLIF